MAASRGAMPLGRRPRWATSTGQRGSATRARRASPRPSRRQRGESPTTTARRPGRRREPDRPARSPRAPARRRCPSSAAPRARRRPAAGWRRGRRSRRAAPRGGAPRRWRPPSTRRAPRPPSRARLRRRARARRRPRGAGALRGEQQRHVGRAALEHGGQLARSALGELRRPSSSRRPTSFEPTRCRTSSASPAVTNCAVRVPGCAFADRRERGAGGAQPLLVAHQQGHHQLARRVAGQRRGQRRERPHARGVARREEHAPGGLALPAASGEETESAGSWRRIACSRRPSSGRGSTP